MGADEILLAGLRHHKAHAAHPSVGLVLLLRQASAVVVVAHLQMSHVVVALDVILRELVLI